MTILDNEYKYYQDNKEHFLSQYEGKFIVIKNKEVIGVFDDKITAVEETRKKHELGTFIVQEVIKNDVITFHSRVLIGKNNKKNAS